MVWSARARMGASCSRSYSMLFGHREFGAERMRTARLAEAAHQRGVVGFEENKPGADLAADAPEQRREALQRLAFANVHHDGGAARGIVHQFGELRNQVERQIVDGMVAEVFQRLEHRAFAGAAEAGDDDQFRAG